MNNSRNYKIAKNTFLLYARMLLVMAINIYTSRVILDALGVVDFGVYNVVGGVVALFTFLSSSMSNSTLRFITFSLGKGEVEELKKTFTTSVQIHFIISLVILLFAETLGLWFLNNKIVIPEERMTAAQWVYQLSILSCLLSIVVVPYISLIKAHERMGAFAIISIVDVILKLVVAFVIQLFGIDRLVFYAFLILLIHALDLLLYYIYCHRHYIESKLQRVFDGPLFKRMISFAGWSLVGNFAWMGYTQGLNILLNLFFGPVVNTARGVAVQVQNAIKGFVTNFQTAINPQITKSYANGEFVRLRKLIYTGSKLSYYLLLIVVIPLIYQAGPILSVWLKEVPDHTVAFMQLSLCVLLIEPLANPIGIANNATGDIKVYQLVEGGLLILIVPIAYLCLKLGANPESVFIVQIIVSLIVQFVRVILVRKKLDIQFNQYLEYVVFYVMVVSVLSVSISFLLLKIFTDSFIGVIAFIIISCCATTGISYLFGLNKEEKEYINSKASLIKNKFISNKS